MSLYPSLEDLVVGRELVAQEQLVNKVTEAASSDTSQLSVNYKALASEYLGIDLSKVTYDNFGNPVYKDSTPGSSAMIPKSSNSIVSTQSSGSIVGTQAVGAIVPSDPVIITQHVREILVKKNPDGYLGLGLKNQDAGVFVVFVEENSPAAHAGLRFGDQILSVNGKYVAGMKGKEVMKFISKNCGQTFSIVVRDRPLERVITLAKDSHGRLGFIFKKGVVEAVVEGSSAERNGVLINSHLCEIEGVNVLGMDDKKISELIEKAGRVVKITVIPKFYYENLSKKLGRSQFKSMDRTSPII